MSEELYNSNDYCKLAEEFEELKKENAELARDKDHLMNLFMESSEYVFNVVSNMKINDLGQKCKRLEADYEISNRELLVKQVEITALRAEIERLHAAQRRWRVVANGELPELGKEVIFYDSKMEGLLKGCLRKNGGVEWLSDEGYTFSSRDGRYSRITHWMYAPQPPEVQE